MEDSVGRTLGGWRLKTCTKTTIAAAGFNPRPSPTPRVVPLYGTEQPVSLLGIPTKDTSRRPRPSTSFRRALVEGGVHGLARV